MPIRFGARKIHPPISLTRLCRCRIAIGTAVLFALQILLLMLLFSCTALRRSKQRSEELLEVNLKTATALAQVDEANHSKSLFMCAGLRLEALFASRMF